MSYAAYTTDCIPQMTACNMKPFVYLFGLVASMSLVSFFGWPILLACAGLSLGTLLFSTATTEAGQPQLKNGELHCHLDIDPSPLA